MAKLKRVAGRLIITSGILGTLMILLVGWSSVTFIWIGLVMVAPLYLYVIVWVFGSVLCSALITWLNWVFELKLAPISRSRTLRWIEELFDKESSTPAS